jgi:hypothetical protein
MTIFGIRTLYLSIKIYLHVGTFCFSIFSSFHTFNIYKPLVVWIFRVFYNILMNRILSFTKCISSCAFWAKFITTAANAFRKARWSFIITLSLGFLFIIPHSFPSFLFLFLESTLIKKLDTSNNSYCLINLIHFFVST